MVLHKISLSVPYNLQSIFPLSGLQISGTITGCQRKQSKKADHIRRSFERLVLNFLYSSNLSYSLPMLPHSGQSSQLLFDADDRIAQSLPTIAENVVAIDKQNPAIQQKLNQCRLLFFTHVVGNVTRKACSLVL